MNQLIQCKATILPVLIGGVLACFGLSPKAEAVLPAPDGGYPGGNTAEGQSALLSLTTGGFNTAVGWLSLSGNTGGSYNTAIGAGALISNTTGVSNAAIGVGALLYNTTGSSNTATGVFALANNTIGEGNTANGVSALAGNTFGDENTANGHDALASNTSGVGNTATGYQALLSNIGGYKNTADGYRALFQNSTGEFNTAIGFGTLFINTTGSHNIALGDAAGLSVTAADNVICIGSNVAGTNVSNTCFIGNIFGVTTGMDAVSVVVDANGQLGTIPSSRRYKRDIQPMDKTSEAILSFKPVTFHYKNGKKDTPQFGLIAEDVAQVNPDLVVRDKGGEIYTVRYDAVNAMLLNEFLKEHKKVENQQVTIGQLKSSAAKQEATINELKKDVGVLTAQLKEQAAQIQGVNARIEANDLRPHVVVSK